MGDSQKSAQQIIDEMIKETAAIAMETARENLRKARAEANTAEAIERRSSN